MRGKRNQGSLRSLIPALFIASRFGGTGGTMGLPPQALPEGDSPLRLPSSLRAGLKQLGYNRILRLDHKKETRKQSPGNFFFSLQQLP